MTSRASYRRVGAGGLGIVIVAAMILYWTWPTLDHDGGGHPGVSSAAHAQGTRAPQVAPNPDTVDLSETQLAFVKVALVAEREFPIQKDAIGSIDFNQNMTVQVFTPYPGRIIALFAEVGADVNKGQKLFTIDSPDLLQAESTLIASAGVMDLTSRNLTRLRELYTTRAVSQHDLEQATSDQQTAEGNLRAARDALRLFGKTDADIDHIIATRSADPTLVVPSPISGRVTARNAAPGLFVQPGSGVAPYTVADVNTMWMIANVAEDDSPVFRVGQPEQVRIDAFPGRVFDAKVTTIAAFVDPATRRVVVRSEIKDPQHELRSGMFASFTVGVGAPQRSPAIAVDGVVREGDGAMTIWVTTDRRRFMRRTVKVGRQYQGYWQILDGVKAGELVATEGAVFLSNAFATQSP